MAMLLRYIGPERAVSFIPDSYYEARKIHDNMGEAYAIFDEGYDWYRYGARFVAENFEVVAEDAQELRQAV